MISQLDGLVKALRGRGNGRRPLVAVLGTPGGLALELARLLFACGRRPLLLSLEGGKGWGVFLQGKGSLESCAEIQEGYWSLGGAGNYAFPAWATGESARRLLEGLHEASAPWDCVVLDLGREHNEGVAQLASACDPLCIELPGDDLGLAHMLSLSRDILSRTGKIGVYATPSASLEAGEARLLSKLFLQAASKMVPVPVRFLHGEQVVEELAVLVGVPESGAK